MTTAEMEARIRALLAAAEPMTERERRLQRFSFAYGNLACTTNHQPSRLAFKAIALKEGWTEQEFDEWAEDKLWRITSRYE